MHNQKIRDCRLRLIISTYAFRAIQFAIVFLCVVLACAFSSSAVAQNQKDAKNAKEPKQKKEAKQKIVPIHEVQQLPELSASAPVVPLTDTQAIDLAVAQMLAAWQIGDVDLLHSFYSDDALVVSGAWEPPLQGWQNYARAYQAQRARTQAVRLDRTNSFTKVDGETAMCTYQWQFNGQVDGAPSSAFGQTTLMLQKRAGKWLIILNHTSIAPTPERAVPTSALPPGVAGRTESAAVPGR